MTNITGNELKITSEELYYLGTILQAKYIDYVYIAAMEDIGKNYDLFESKVKNSLNDKGILMEDFSGNMELSEETKKLLEPVFFGTEEAAVDIGYMENGQGTGKTSVHFHFYEGRMTMITILDKELEIKSADDAALQKYIKTLEAANEEAEEKVLETESMNQNLFKRVIAIKRVSLGEMTYVDIYVDYDGCIYKEDENGHAAPMKKEEFNMTIYHGLKGE